LGIPVPLATYLTNLGALSFYRLSSPYGLRANLDPSAEGVNPTTDNPWIPTRGGTQGNPLNTLGWVVFFYILLTALNEVQREYPFYIRHMVSTLILQLPACYADDLHLISACREATIKCNCLISAFAAMFGIEVAPEKLRAITTAEEPGVVILYDREWIPIVKPFGDKEELMKSVGISNNLILDWNIQFEALEAKVAKVASILGRRQAITMDRAMAQGVVTLPQILYPVQWLHAEVLSNRVLGGFMGDVYSLAQEAKLRLFDSAMEEGGLTRRAMECLYLRLLCNETSDRSLIHSSEEFSLPS
jgi:hypothetical protein